MSAFLIDSSIVGGEGGDEVPGKVFELNLGPRISMAKTPTTTERTTTAAISFFSRLLYLVKVYLVLYFGQLTLKIRGNRPSGAGFPLIALLSQYLIYFSSPQVQHSYTEATTLSILQLDQLHDVDFFLCKS